MTSSFQTKYKIFEKIGEGSFSEVLKCQNRETGQFFAAKRLKKCYKSLQEVYACSEIVAMRKINRHPNILYIIETHYEQLLGRVTLIFELLDMTLYDFMKVRKRTVPEARAKNYIYQLLKGLHHLHKNGLFHRDIKPENILLKLSNTDPLNIVKGEIIKLGDLGSIRGIYSKPPYTEYISTRWYRSPECLLTTGYYGSKMDIWAVGCVFYEILTLKPLFPGNDEIDQIHRIHMILGTPSTQILTKFRRHKSRNCSFNFPFSEGTGFGNLLPSMSADGKDVLKHMLAYDPDHRNNVRQILGHKYFEELREQDSFAHPINKRALSNSKRASSDKSIGDCKNKLLKPPAPSAKAPSNLSTKVERPSKIEPTNSEVIRNDQIKMLRSKSGSINLNRITKIIDRPIVKECSKPPPQQNLSQQKSISKTWDLDAKISTRLSLLRSAQKIKQKRVESLLAGKKNNSGIMSKVQPSQIAKLTGKTASDPESSPRSGSSPRKQFASKSFSLPRPLAVKVKLSTIAEDAMLLKSKKGAILARPMSRRNNHSKSNVLGSNGSNKDHIT